MASAEPFAEEQRDEGLWRPGHSRFKHFRLRLNSLYSLFTPPPPFLH